MQAYALTVGIAGIPYSTSSGNQSYNNNFYFFQERGSGLKSEHLDLILTIDFIYIFAREIQEIEK